MTDPSPYALTLSHRVLRVLIVINLLAGAAILSLLLASIVDRDLIMRALGVESMAGSEHLKLGMQTIAALGVCAVLLAHVVLKRLKAIVETVSDGDPFVLINAERLKTIAWSVLALEILHLAIGAIAAAVSTEAQPLDIDWEFSATRWVAVLLCFVLARVFEQGARMRDDLVGIV
jgi:hypothetical protein